MRQTDKHLRLATTLLVLLLVFIWGNSLLPAQVSAAISGWIWNLLGDFGGEAVIQDSSIGDGPLRKAAHFIEFASLGMCLAWIMVMVCRPTLFALAGGSAAACVDEIIQIFVPGRGPAVADVLLDTAGVLTGLLIFLLFRHLRRYE